MNRIGLFLIGSASFAALAFAQEAPPAPDAAMTAKPVMAFRTQIIGPGPFGKPVLNAPYQGQTETVTVQHLADGNTIQNTHTSKVARDSQGRTWTQETITNLGPWASDNGPQTVVFINDPVANVSYVLHPERKVAEKMPMRPHRGDVVTRRAEPGPPPGAGAGNIMFSAAAGPLPDGGPGLVQTSELRLGPPEGADHKTEDLGTQQVNGVPATGKRITDTIPANAIGNQLPITSVMETWTAPDLQVVVESKRTDPRFGDTTFSLKNIQKGEPPADLFQVPSDYTITDAPRFTMPFKPHTK